ncbi:MAG: efflux RND transporter periplasmic adaptor subunit [Deltaproteobacteria bacterium]|jgi:Cu(I)/Ag(I) efflux system membrane fusion protein|nr:efflux RND transporter periplasmic adaptor subunit [Deltaproteobacteria bacterium]
MQRRLRHFGLGLALLAGLAIWAPWPKGPLAAQERQVLYWYDPMYPNARFEKPGRSPFMDMDLIPRYADEGQGEGIRIDPTLTQNLGLKTALAKTGRLTYAREIPANVEFNGYQRARLQSRAEGFVAKTFNFSVGDLIKEGEAIAVVTAPGWASDQSEYLLLKSQKADRRIVAGVREKLRLGGMPEEMLQAVDQTGQAQTDLYIKSPVSGVVTALDVYQGMNVGKDMTLAEIQGFNPIWVTADVPELDLALAQGRARVTALAWPGRAFESLGSVLLPQANKGARTVPLRLTVANPEGLLRPGLTASVRLRGQGPEGVLIPTQSLIDLGEEKRVIVVTHDGTFLPKAVKVGGSAREETLIAEGLEPGESVVVSGLFLIDSEANLAGALDRLSPNKPPLAAPEIAASPAAASPEAQAGPKVDPGQGQPSQGQSGHGQPSQGQSGQGQPSQGQPSHDQPSQGQSGPAPTHEREHDS